MPLPNNNQLKGLATQGVSNVVLPKLVLRPYPERLLKLAPEMKAFRAEEQADMDTFLSKLGQSLRGKAS